MNAITLTLFVSLLLAVGSVLFFLWGYHQRDYDHTDRLSLLPLDEKDGRVPTLPAPTKEGTPR